jgi:hypothetical protein
MCGTVHTKALAMIVDQIDYEDEDVTNPDNTIMACKTCVRSRDRRPLMSYMKRRLIAAKAEVAYLSDLKENIRVQRILTVPIIMGDYAPSITTPNAVGITGSTAAERRRAEVLKDDADMAAQLARYIEADAADADYASRITTPNAVDGTGSTEEGVMKDLLDRYNDA